MTPLRTQQAAIDVMSLGPSPDIDSLDSCLDFGAPRELQHAEALVLVTLLGPVTAARQLSFVWHPILGRRVT